jgi:hypothetical protein
MLFDAEAKRTSEVASEATRIQEQTKCSRMEALRIADRVVARCVMVYVR